MPYKNGNIVWNMIDWTDDMKDFLINNYKSMTNQQLADHFGLKLTVTRNKLRELGLKRMELEYWSEEMKVYLINNYQTMGDVEIMNYFKQYFPKKKGWKRNAIRKKRNYLGLHRTEEQIAAIVAKNTKRGGPSFTIEKNSSSLNFHPTWVAQQIAWRNPELQKEIIENHPELIEEKTAVIKLNQAIKKALVIEK